MSLIEMKEYLSKLLENFSVVIDLEMTILNIDPFDGLPGPETFFSRKVTRKMKRSMKNGKEAIQTR